MITITDGINILSMYFLENSTLKFTDISKLIPKQFKQPHEKESVHAALIGSLNSEEFSPLVQLVTPIATDINSYHWVLKKSLFENPQTVTLNGEMCLQIAQIVNSFLDEKTGKCNPLNIKENDISHLLGIIQFLSDNNSNDTNKENKTTE